MAKGKRRRMARAAGRVAMRAGKSFARKFREKRAKGLLVSAAVAGAAGWYESNKTAAELALYDKTPGQDSVTKTDAVGFAATGIALWSGNEMAYDVACGLLPLTTYRMVRARAGSGRPAKAEGDFDEAGADDDDVTAYAGAVELDDGI